MLLSKQKKKGREFYFILCDVTLLYVECSHHAIERISDVYMDIWDALRDLAPFVQFKKLKKHP